MPPTPTAQQRRAADRRTGSDREGLLRLLFIGILLAAVGGFGWWYWQYAGGHLVHDSAPSWSPDSTHVVFVSDAGGKSDIFLTDINGRSRQQLTNTGSNEGSPAFSPDGRQIAFDTDRDGNSEIYVMQPDGLAPQRLTNHAAKDLAPSWSPDGKFIVFMSTRDNPQFDLYRMDADGRNVTRLTTTGGMEFPQVSPDGTQIAYQNVRDIYVLLTKTLTVRRLTHEPLNGMYPTWSSDGKQIAFTTWRNGRSEIFTARSSGIEQQLVVSMPSGDAVEPRWSPNGDYIAFVHIPGGRGADGAGNGERRLLYVVDIRTKHLTRLSR